MENKKYHTFIEVAVPSLESEWSCICVSGVWILPLSTILIFDLGIVQTVCFSIFKHLLVIVSPIIFI
jgi:hypothetical protein